MHIEQGPALVEQQRACGIVTGIRGNLRYKHACVTGEYGHAGAVPRLARRDAVFAATEFVQHLEALWLAHERNGDDLVATVGQLYTDSAVHTMTKISGEVRFTLDIRSHDEKVLQNIRAQLATAALEIGKRRRVLIDLGETIQGEAAVMNADLRAKLHQIAANLNIAAPDIPSGAGHDCAVFAGEGIPCAMIFVRNDHGSHNPHEAMTLEDFGEACRLLFGLLDEIA